MEQHHHYGWMVTAIIIVCVGVYAWSVNRPDNYGKDSTHNEQHRQDWPFSIHIGEGGCANLAALRTLGKTHEKSIPIVNSVKP